MEGQTVASMNAAAGQQKAAPTKPAKRRQVELTVTFVVPVNDDANPNEAVETLIRTFPSDQLLGGSSFERFRPCWFLVKLTDRVGKRTQLSFDYRRPGSPRH